jgi:mono/diheme cytochrome c family protein
MRRSRCRARRLPGLVGALLALAAGATGCLKASEGPSVAAPSQGVAAQSVFSENCAGCHGERGQGVPGSGIPLTRAGKMDPAAIKQLLHNGRGKMPAVPLEEPELSAVIAYVKQLPAASPRAQ